VSNHLHRLVGLQRAQAGKAAKLQSWILFVQIALALLAAATVYIANDTGAYLAAVATFGLAAVWAFLGWRYRDGRGQSERARRATLLMNSLGAELAPSDRRDLEACFNVTAEQGRACEDPDYYAAGAIVGNERLAEMLEETAFWSSRLMRYSARQTWWLFAVFMLLFLVLLLSSLPFVGVQHLLGAVRVGCAMLVLLVSTDIIGAALSYTSAANVLDRMGPRLDRVRTAGFPLHDLLFILCDYNSAVEGAPMFGPGIYAKHKDELNRLWVESQS
jgi:hypothetical protein